MNNVTGLGLPQITIVGIRKKKRCVGRVSENEDTVGKTFDFKNHTWDSDMYPCAGSATRSLLGLMEIHACTTSTKPCQWTNTSAITLLWSLHEKKKVQVDWSNPKSMFTVLTISSGCSSGEYANGVDNLFRMFLWLNYRPVRLFGWLLQLQGKPQCSGHSQHEALKVLSVCHWNKSAWLLTFQSRYQPMHTGSVAVSGNQLDIPVSKTD